ncbi:MAG: aminotransferase class I/II-fold pyridoxal phosphate-dependent enzyme [Ruminococcaceae bacterium]|nr:aminotransferase class I/II-fold pyridoxal phosphate-dependent enzyme [Oscillospiraceae bacterium]
MIDYSKVLSKTVVDTPKSGIRKFFDLMSTMTDVVGLTVGEPDFQTPWHIREAGIQSLEKGKTYYTANAGLMDLRSEINTYMTRRFRISYKPESEVIVTVGGSEAIDIAFRAVIEAGDEVIIPTPSFVCYAPLVSIAGGTPVILETKFENKFKIDPEALKAAITPKTKMLVLPYPNNPTGAIMTREELEDIAEILRDTNILVLSDEIYAEMTYTGDHCSIASIDGMWERTIVASGFSKAYAMTGWRLGYICAPKALCEQMLKIHQYGIMSSPTTAQFAAIEALKNGDDDIRMMVDEYNRRRRYIFNGLKSIGIESFEPEGAFYIFPKIGDFGLSGEEFCNKLLYDYKCAIVPGNAFGKSGEGFARISYAYSIKHITQALERIEAFVKTL